MNIPFYLKIELFDKVKEQLTQCVVSNTEDVIPADGDAYFGLPKPYSVPTPGCTFRELYYWDTYFTNKGLILTGKVQQAINNLENFHIFSYIYQLFSK